MKKFIIPLIVSLYLTCISFFMVNVLDWFMYVFYGLVVLNIILIIINILYPIINHKKLNPKSYKEIMIYKLILIPYFIFNFVVGVVILLMGLLSFITIFFFAGIPLLLMAFLVCVASYVVILATSSYEIILLIKGMNKKTVIFNIIMIILNFIYVLDVVGSIITFINYKNENKEVAENE